MNIVNFTPLSATLGGLLIGLAVVVFFLCNGRLVGISGIAANALIEKDKKFDNLLFLIGLIIGPTIYSLFTSSCLSRKIKYYQLRLIKKHQL